MESWVLEVKPPGRRSALELDLRNKNAFGAAAEKLNGKRVVVTGTIFQRQGAESGMRTMLTVESFKQADR